MVASPTVFEIDPRRFHKAKFYLRCLTAFRIVWFPLTCAVTVMLFSGGPVLFLIAWLTIAWTGVILIPIGVMRNRKQLLTAAGDRLLITGLKPFFMRRIELHGDQLAALTLER